MNIRICKGCGVTFEVTGTRLFCNDVCSSEYRVKYRKDRWKNCEKSERTCLNCEKKFLRQISKKGQFCSRSCGSKWHVKNGNFDAWVHRIQEKTGKFVKCSGPNCQNEIYVEPRFNNIEIVKLCSLECEKKYFSRKMSGNKNPMYGKRLSSFSNEKKQLTLLKNHGVKNAFLLSKRRTVSKAQFEIYEFLSKEFPQMNFQKEKMLKTEAGEYYLDVVSDVKNIVIEYNGDYWHCNPKKYKYDFFHHVKKMSAKEIWDADDIRINMIKNYGYTVIIVWENDFKLSKNEIFQSLVRSINGEKENISNL